MYGVIGQTLGRKRREIQLNENFDFDTNLFIEEAKSDGGGIIFLAFPNNPTGNCFKKESVLRLIKEADSLVIIDEAYYDFSGETFLPAISDYENLIILRTFSKAFGLAGLRIGYLVSNPEIVRYLFKVKLPFNVNIFSQKVASILLENVELLKDRIKEIIDEREELYAYLRKLNGIHPYPSRCNFILFRTLTTPASKVFDCLAGDGILIRDVSDEGLLKNCLRVTIGSPHENRIFKEKISEIFKGS
jgi:histidinol-phosphate aminotransferase